MTFTTNPDFPAPRLAAPPALPAFPHDSTFIVLDLFTPWRTEHLTLEGALIDANTSRFPDDILILAYASGGALLAVLTTQGLDVTPDRGIGPARFPF